MKAILFLFLMFAGGFFAWMYLLKRRDKRIASKWGRRVLLTLFLAAAVVLTLFGFLSLNSWRLF